MAENLFYGWFDDAAQTKPSYDPPLDAPCPFCGTKITRDNVRTHSIMAASGYAKRSYFYRTHKTCADRDVTGVGMDDFIFGLIANNGD